MNKHRRIITLTIYLIISELFHSFWRENQLHTAKYRIIFITFLIFDVNNFEFGIPQYDVFRNCDSSSEKVVDAREENQVCCRGYSEIPRPIYAHTGYGKRKERYWVRQTEGDENPDFTLLNDDMGETG